jgi:putative transposase
MFVAVFDRPRSNISPKRSTSRRIGRAGGGPNTPTRQREKIMKRFKSASQLQRFVSIHDPIANLFHFPRHALSASDHRDLRRAAMATWREIAHLAAA